MRQKEGGRGVVEGKASSLKVWATANRRHPLTSIVPIFLGKRRGTGGGFERGKPKDGQDQTNTTWGHGEGKEVTFTVGGFGKIKV